MDREANASSCLGDEGSLVKSLVYAINGIVLHGDQEAGAHLWLWCTGIEQSWCRMGEPLLTDQVIGVYGSVDIVLVDSHSHPHNHMLGSLNDFAMDLKKI